jgi:hypothetical protein
MIFICFQIGFLVFYCWVVEFLYILHGSPLLDMGVCKCFLTICSLYFHLSNGLFHRANIFHFDEVWFINFSFNGCAFGIKPNILCLALYPQIFSYFCYVYVSDPFWVHYYIRLGFNFLSISILFSSTITFPSPNHFYTILKIQLSIFVWVYFWVLWLVNVVDYIG